ncbi:MAG: hypothetical protein HQ580_09195, partial [Planctomycetes bacterium]|nr:hypothetical protein [Planctomycetota bacterium]
MKFATDIKIKAANVKFRKLLARYPIKFGNVVIDYIILSLVEVRVENRNGKVGCGYGSMPFAHLWGWPESDLSPTQKDREMLKMLSCACHTVLELNEYLHPLKIHHLLEERILKDETGPMPKLNTLVSISPLDAAIHDAFGNLEQKDVYTMYSREFVDDLSSLLGAKYTGRYISDYLLTEYKERLPIFHLVGGLDPLSTDEVKNPINDGRPETLEEWIERDGIYCLKIKWRGNDLAWDLARALDVFKIAKGRLPDKKLFFTGDTNEQCRNPEYMIELLTKIEEHEGELFESILYIEQPTHRDIWEHPHDFSALSNIKPVIIDESLVDLETFQKGLDLGAKGIALKTCKGHSASLIYMAKCEEEGVPYAVQDLSLPGLSFIH